jgi:integrase
MASITKLSSGSYRCQIRRKGFPTEGETFSTKAEADAWGKRREKEITGVIASRRPVTGGLRFKDLVDKYLNSTPYKNKSEGTQKRELVSAAPILARLGETPVELITGASIQMYLDDRQLDRPLRRVKGKDGVMTSKPIDGKTISGHTVRLDKAFLSSVFRYAKRRDLVPANIMMDSFDLPETNQRELRILPEQQYKLFSAAQEMSKSKRTNQSLLPWLHFVFATGTRPGEAAKIELAWCDLKDSAINIPRRGQKKRNPRVVLIGDELLKKLKAQYARAKAAGSPYLFWSEGNSKGGVKKEVRAIKPYGYYSAWRRIALRAGIDATCPHIVRHEFICRLFENPRLNLSDGQIASLVGDVNTLSLEPYKHLRARALRGEHSKHLLDVANQVQAVGIEQTIKQNPVFAEVLEFGLEKLRSKENKSAKDEATLAAIEAQLAIALKNLDA